VPKPKKGAKKGDAPEGGFELLSSCSGSELVGLRYEPLFPYFGALASAFRVVADGYVTDDSGTGARPGGRAGWGSGWGHAGRVVVWQVGKGCAIRARVGSSARPSPALNARGPACLLQASCTRRLPLARTTTACAWPTG
jgi:hypothetical protein